MRTSRPLAAALIATAAVLAPVLPAQAGTNIYANCTALQRVYPHGIGRSTAHDHTSGTPVTTFRHDTAGYNKAISANSGLDRDKDGIACEKR